MVEPVGRGTGDRQAHKIGQEKVVQVIKIITRETVEEKYSGCSRQEELIESVIRPGENLINNMTTDELRQPYILAVIFVVWSYCTVNIKSNECNNIM